MKKGDFFARCVQTAAIVAAIQRGRTPAWAASVMAEAMFVPEDALPDNFVKIGHMALEMIGAVCMDQPYPEWYKDGWSGDEW